MKHEKPISNDKTFAEKGSNLQNTDPHKKMNHQKLRQNL